jgi:hypothetical protein
MKTSNQDSHLNWAPPKYKLEAFLHEPACAVEKRMANSDLV